MCAHWDTRHVADHDTERTNEPILGANDGGSGVGVLLELARQLALQNSNIGVDIILFDAEDYGQPQNSLCTSTRYMVYWVTVLGKKPSQTRLLC